MNVESPPPNDSKRRQQTGADWTSWAMHLVAGMILGGIFAVGLAYQLSGISRLEIASAIPAVLGGALIVGAIASHIGDRLWMRRSIFDADAPPRSRASKIASLLIGIAGAGVIAVSAARACASRSSLVLAISRPHQGLSILAIPCVMVPSLLLWWALRTGVVVTRRSFIDRSETPFIFWFFIASYIACLVAAVWLLW